MPETAPLTRRACKSGGINIEHLKRLVCADGISPSLWSHNEPPSALQPHHRHDAKVLALYAHPGTCGFHCSDCNTTILFHDSYWPAA